MTTREAVAAFYALQIYISSLPDLVPQHAMNLDSMRLPVVTHSVRQTTAQKKIANFFSPIEG